jgi:hypothetical protein
MVVYSDNNNTIEATVVFSSGEVFLSIISKLMKKFVLKTRLVLYFSVQMNSNGSQDKAVVVRRWHDRYGYWLRLF